MKRRGVVAVAVAIGLAGAVGATTRFGSDGSPVAERDTADRTVVSGSLGNDASVALRELEGRRNVPEAEREAEREREREGEEREGEEREGGERPTVLGESERERLRRVPKRVEAHEPDGALQRVVKAPGRGMPVKNIDFAGIDSVASGCGCLPPDTNGEMARMITCRR